jgi:hypothetical protein
LIKSIYLIGSLRNPNIPRIGDLIRKEVGIEAFNDWHSAGPDADDYLRDHYRQRGFSYREGINSYAARHIYEFDFTHLNRVDGCVMVMPSGKSAHLEFGYMVGKGKPSFILMDGEPERFEVMHNFATDIFLSEDEMIHGLQQFKYREAVDDYSWARCTNA